MYNLKTFIFGLLVLKPNHIEKKQSLTYEFHNDNHEGYISLD